MTALEIQHSLESDLRKAVLDRRAPTPPIPNLLSITPWVAMSLLQKAIRRGRVDFALGAASTLLREAPDRLWRRLGCIACEDIGLGGLEAVGLATAALAGKRLRAELGGEWAVASFLVDELCRAAKCRAADDLLMACELDPSNAKVRAALRGQPASALLDIVAKPGPIDGRALAFCYALGAGPRAFALVRKRAAEAQWVFERLAQDGWPPRLVEIARLNYRRTGEMLGPFVALLWHEWQGALPGQGDLVDRSTHSEAEEWPPEAMIGGALGILGWAYDLYSREGRAAFAAFLRTEARSASWIRRYVRPNRRIAFLGHLVFRVEGDGVDRRLRWPLAGELRHRVDVGCSRPECSDASEIIALVDNDIPRLNEVRAEIAKTND
jgi:hypothetical protein